MGKNQKKKGKGAEKTAAKTDKKLSQKMKKKLAVTGEEDIESIVAQMEKEEQRKLQVKETVVSAPYRRAFVTLTAHPFKDELVMFGGEFHNGQETQVYNDLFVYKITKNEWTMVRSPGAPPPRSGHQAVAVGSNRGEIWVFGGEYTTKSESQFYHYKDLWVLNLETKQWTKVNSPGGPSARSGHRMVCLKRQLFVFGGYHDNLQDHKYFNDVHIFNLDDRKWSKIEPSGTAPSPRSGCQMVATPDGKVLIWGGYSRVKVKKDVDSGQVHDDMFLLSPERGDASGLKWKWSTVKPGGCRPAGGRSGTTSAATPDRAFSFGGAADTEEGDEEISSVFSNDLHSLDLKKFIWTEVVLSGKKSETKKRRRRKEKDSDNEGSNGEEEEEEDDPMEEKETVVADDGVFTVTVGPARSSAEGEASVGGGMAGTSPGAHNPSSRINTALVIKGSRLFLYGGIFEKGDKQFTLSDFYSLDLHKLDEWKTLIAYNLDEQEWIESEESDGDDEEMETAGSEDDDSSEESDEDD